MLFRKEPMPLLLMLLTVQNAGVTFDRNSNLVSLFLYLTFKTYSLFSSNLGIL